MSSQSLDPQKEKMDEVTDNEKNGATEPAATKSFGSRMQLFLIIGLLVVILFLHVASIAKTMYDNYAVQESDKVCNCTDGVEQAKLQTCNSLQINETHQATQDIRQMMNHTTREIMQLLQQIITDQMSFGENVTEIVSFLQDQTENSLTRLTDTLSTHKDTSDSIAAVINSIFAMTKELMQQQNASLLLNSNTYVSCKNIHLTLPDSPSGFYYVNSRMIYCNMEELCGSEGGWTRLAYLDMTDSKENCPNELHLYQSNGIRACGRSSSGCSSSIKFQTNGIKYSEICGRVHSYQKGTPDAFKNSNGDINSHYVDGVSLTRGYPRHHVWTFACGLKGNFYHDTSNCPCNTKPSKNQKVPAFVGSNYSCESGNHGTGKSLSEFYAADLLWDGQNCGSKEQACCSDDGTPWFHRQYDNTSTDYIELRICGDSETNDEDTPVSLYEIYVK